MFPHHVAVSDGAADAIAHERDSCCDNDHDAEGEACQFHAKREEYKRQPQADCRDPLIEKLLVFVFLLVARHRFGQKAAA